MNYIKIIQGDALEKLKELPDLSIHCCITSPPYYNLRDYKVKGQIGIEKTHKEYIKSLVCVFREVKRVLRDDGTFWLNIGDKWGKNGDLIGIPWMLAFALRDDGWRLRSENIWYKINGMPESVKNRPTYSHEQIFMFKKSDNYYYDWVGVREKFINVEPQYFAGNKWAAASRNPSGNENPDANPWISDGFRSMRDVWPIVFDPYKGSHYAVFPRELPKRIILAGTSDRGVCIKCGNPWIRNIKTIVKAGHRESREWDSKYKGGTDPATSIRKFEGWNPSCKCDAEVKPAIVLDPFFGAGTTGLVAGILKRDCIGIELNSDSCRQAKDRINSKGGFFFKAEVI